MKKGEFYLRAFIAALTAASLFFAPVARADMRPLAEADMADVSGAGGISIGIGDLSIYIYTDAFSYTDTDTGSTLSLEGVSLSDGQYRPASFRVGDVDTNGDGIESPLTIEVGGIDDPASPVYGKPGVLIEALDWQQAVNLHADMLRFCGQELGSLDIGVITRPTYYWMVGAHGDGLDFEFGQRLSIDDLRLTYDTAGDGFAFSGIHLGGSDASAPEDPAAWQMTGVFRIGALPEGNPATLDVGAGADGLAAVALNLPMSGSLRVENVHWEATDFGPIAIDGITVHRLGVRLIP